jgi:predicted DNA-binding transcriptional regulator YafY
MRQILNRAMHQSDDLVVTFEYCDAKGSSTRRVVSPIRFLARTAFWP